MLIKNPKGWEISENLVTSESQFLNRRNILQAMGLASASAMSASFLGGTNSALAATDPTTASDLYPGKLNETYKVVREITPEKYTSTYNNFYEFGSHKSISQAAQALVTEPWPITIDGEVEKEIKIDFEDLVRKMGVEERVYRFRCVEAWSMIVPWSGFPLRKLVEFANPKSSAKYVRFETFLDPSIAPGQRQVWYPWPYVEAVTIEEATIDLPFMVTGVYGKPMAKQFGAPMRLALPWKYGFKSIKSIVKITFTEERPVSMWEKIAANEYGFWANVNPEVSHPRWSQATERVLGSGERIPTQLYNGYGEFVASLYSNLQDQQLYR